MFLHSYIIKAAQDALVDLNAVEMAPAGAPVVAPPDAPLFPDDILRQIEFHKDKALNVQDFEGFMGLLDAVIAELKLNEAKDRTNLAAVLNKYRQDAELSLF